MRKKNIRELIFEVVSKAMTYIYTITQRSRFAFWGRRSRAGLFLRLEEPQLISVGSHVTIGAHTWLNAKDWTKLGDITLKIGDGCYIGRFVQVNAWKDVTIEKNVLIGDRVFISDADHKFENLRLPIIQQGDHFKGAVSLGEGSWIGIGAVILPGVRVGRNAVVGANSVVTHSVPDYTVVAGNPAKVIKTLE